MKQALDILHDLSSDAAVRRRAKDREDRLELDAMYQAGAIREARELGRQEGRIDALRALAFRMRAQGASDATTADTLGVRVEELIEMLADDDHG